MKAFKDMTEPEIKKIMSGIADSIKSSLPKRELFCLIVFSADQIGQYISNANRQDIIKALREFADVLESREDVPR